MITCNEVFPALENIIALACLTLCMYIQGGNGACCADWASADPHTPPSSSPQSWGLKAPGQRKGDDTLPQSLGKNKEEISGLGQVRKYRLSG